MDHTPDQTTEQPQDWQERYPRVRAHYESIVVDFATLLHALCAPLPNGQDLLNALAVAHQAVMNEILHPDQEREEAFMLARYADFEALTLAICAAVGDIETGNALQTGHKILCIAKGEVAMLAITYPEFAARWNADYGEAAAETISRLLQLPNELGQSDRGASAPISPPIPAPNVTPNVTRFRD